MADERWPGTVEPDHTAVAVSANPPQTGCALDWTDLRSDYSAAEVSVMKAMMASRSRSRSSLRRRNTITSSSSGRGSF